MTNCQKSGKTVTRHNSVSLRPICFILSGRRSLFDRLILYNQEQRAVAKKYGFIRLKPFFLIKKRKFDNWNMSLLGEFASDFLHVSGNDRILRV